MGENENYEFKFDSIETLKNYVEMLTAQMEGYFKLAELATNVSNKYKYLLIAFDNFDILGPADQLKLLRSLDNTCDAAIDICKRNNFDVKE